MPSLRTDLDFARTRKKFPEYADGSMHDLGLKLKLTSPISLRALDDALGRIPPASVWYESPPMNALHVDGSAKVFFQSDGLFSFIGKVHENGIVGANYLVTMTFLEIKDGDGKTPVFEHHGNVKGELVFGSSDDDWKVDGFAQVIMDNWETIKNTSAYCKLHVSVDPWQVTEAVLLGLLAAGGAGVGAGLLIISGPSRNTQCGPGLYKDDVGGAGVDYGCKTEW